MKNFIKKWGSFITSGLVAFSSTIGIVRGSYNNPFEDAGNWGDDMSMSNAWKANSTDYDTFIDSLNGDGKPNFMVRLPYTLVNRISNNPKKTGLILVGGVAIPLSLWFVLRSNLEADNENDMELDDEKLEETDT